jgi:hypothetical protein
VRRQTNRMRQGRAVQSPTVPAGVSGDSGEAQDVDVE